jgi:hypothetical protein
MAVGRSDPILMMFDLVRDLLTLWTSCQIESNCIGNTANALTNLFDDHTEVSFCRRISPLERHSWFDL